MRFLLLVALCVFTACTHMTDRYPLRQRQRVALVVCQGSLESAKAKLQKANVEIQDETPVLFYTDWILSRDPLFTESSRHGDGAFLKYKVRKKQNGKIEWSEFKSRNRTDDTAVTDDFYGGERTLARQNKIRETICDDATPEMLIWESKAQLFQLNGGPTLQTTQSPLY